MANDMQEGHHECTGNSRNLTNRDVSKRVTRGGGG